MDRYVVHLSKTVQAHVWAEAPDGAAAAAGAPALPGFPGELDPAAFGDAGFSDEGGWTVTHVTDVAGAVVWRAPDAAASPAEPLDES